MCCEDVCATDFIWPSHFGSLAFATEISSKKITCELARFEPYGAPKLYDPAIICQLNFPFECEGFVVDSWIGFQQAIVVQQNPLICEIDQKTAIWNISNVERTLPLTIGHLCAGAFGGWDRAFNWATSNRIIYKTDVFAVEADFETLRVWAKSNDAIILQGPISPQVPRNDGKVGVVMPIQDITWYNMCRQQVNLVITASPPCQTWSMGGKRLGLEAENGMTFMQVVSGVKWVRPIACLVECSDTVPGHQHYGVIVKSFRYIGYKQVWSQVVPTHDFTGMRRSRWITVFLRNDVQEFDVVGLIKLSDPQHILWSDPTYDFFLPSHVVEQLKLSEELKVIYGDPQYLPGFKHGVANENLRQDDILRTRCVSKEDHLPTLCASYAAQHQIDKKHLCSKGIFASLCVRDGEFCFIDPARFACLLGVTQDQGILLPVNIHDAFHQLGNSISVVHAILGVSIALSILGVSKKPIVQTVERCWESRIRAENTITIVEDEFFHLIPGCCVEETIAKIHGNCEHVEDGIPISVKEVTISFGKNSLISEVLNRFGIENPRAQGIKFVTSQGLCDGDSPIGQFQGMHIQCLKGDCRFLDFLVGLLPVEPTFPWTPHDETSGQETFEDDIDSKILREAAIEAESSLSRTEEIPTEQIAVYSYQAPDIANFVSLQVPIDLDYDQTCRWIASALGCNEQQIVWYETVHFKQPFHQRCVIATDRSSHKDDRHVIVQIQSGRPFPCKIPNHVAPIQIPGCGDSSGVLHNGIFVGANTIVSVQNGDDFVCEENASKRRCINSSNFQKMNLQQRIDLLKETKYQLATDEYAILQRIVNESQSHLECADVWQPSKGIPVSLVWRIHQFVQSDRINMTLACPVLHENHWSSFEITKTPNGLRVNFCNMSEKLLRHVQDELIKKCVSVVNFHDFQTCVIPALDGFCGWAMLFRWFNRFGIVVNQQEVNTLPSEWYAAIHNSVDSKQSFGRITSFALQARITCFQLFGNECQPRECINFGATGPEQQVSDAVMEPQDHARMPDPWLKYDPWKGQKQCKWEDLTLPKDHPIHDNKHSRLQQIHRHQRNQNVGGVAFCTKSNVSEILAKKPKQPFALILPANDKLHFDESLRLKTMPPKEIVVEDGATGAIYKRQIVVVYQGEDILFEFPKPSYKGTLTEKSEIVLEIHSSLVSKESLHSLRDRMHETIKNKVIEQFPSKATEHINIYSIRRLPEAKEPEKFKIQAMCKIDKSLRASFLEASGAGDVIARDFIPKDEQISDITVIPRFWPIDRQGKAEALRSTGSTEGFAGIIATKRGLAVRAWASKVAHLRRILMSQDERITKENIDVVPMISYDSTGWPSSASPNEVINAIAHSCGTPPIPSRCFRAAGVVTWSLGFAVEPKTTKFSVSFNGTTYEILLTKPSEKNKIVKGSKKGAKGTSKGVQSQKEIPTQVPDETADRLTNLETKFAAMERRQDTLENKLQSGFEGVQDQLRQVLNAVQPRASSPSRTGYTPPPKVPKSS